MRAAYSILSDQPVTNLVTPTAGNPPLVTPLTFTGPRSASTTRSPSPGPPGSLPHSVDAGFRNPSIQTWNVNVQRELCRNLTFMVGYFGSKGDHLRVSRNLNQFLTTPHAPLPAARRHEPDPPGSALGNITEVTSLGRSRYDGALVHAAQRFDGGLQFNGSYTLSKSKDTNSLNSQGVVVQDSTDIEGDFAPSDYDVQHRYVLSAIWELPFKGNRLEEGWQIAVVTQGQTGNPINIVTNLNSPATRTSGPTWSATSVVTGVPTVVLECRLRPACRRLLHLELRLRAAGLAGRQVPLRQPRAQRRPGPRLLQHRPLDHQADADRRGHARAAGRGVQRVQPPEPRQPLWRGAPPPSEARASA